MHSQLNRMTVRCIVMPETSPLPRNAELKTAVSIVFVFPVTALSALVNIVQCGVLRSPHYSILFVRVFLVTPAMSSPIVTCSCTVSGSELCYMLNIETWVKPLFLWIFHTEVLQCSAMLYSWSCKGVFTPPQSIVFCHNILTEMPDSIIPVSCYV